MADTKKVTYTLRGEDDPEGVKQIRLTIGKCSVLQMAQYRSETQEVFDWYAEETGMEAGEVTPDLEEVEDDQWPYFWAGLRRARMLASAESVEVRNGDGGPWKDTGIPDEWKGLDSFINEVPTVLFEAWDRLTLELNPGLWSSEENTDSKKEGWLSVD